MDVGRELGHGWTTIARTVSMSVDRISSVLERLEWPGSLSSTRKVDPERIPPPLGSCDPTFSTVCSRGCVGR